MSGRPLSYLYHADSGIRTSCLVGWPHKSHFTTSPFITFYARQILQFQKHFPSLCDITNEGPFAKLRRTDLVPIGCMEASSVHGSVPFLARTRVLDAWGPFRYFSSLGTVAWSCYNSRPRRTKPQTRRSAGVASASCYTNTWMLSFLLQFIF